MKYTLDNVKVGDRFFKCSSGNNSITFGDTFLVERLRPTGFVGRYINTGGKQTFSEEYFNKHFIKVEERSFFFMKYTTKDVKIGMSLQYLSAPETIYSVDNVGISNYVLSWPGHSNWKEPKTNIINGLNKGRIILIGYENIYEVYE